jgi:hypothetical protein
MNLPLQMDHLDGMSESWGIELQETALGRIFRALESHGCEPRWTADGRAIVATCPCCEERNGLVVELPTGEHVERSQ